MEKKGTGKKEENPSDYIIMTKDINMFIVGMKTKRNINVSFLR